MLVLHDFVINPCVWHAGGSQVLDSGQSTGQAVWQGAGGQHQVQ